MRLLLDTHTLLWWQTDPTELSDAALHALKNVENDIFISVVNSWEMQIKAQLGRLSLPRPLPELIQRQLEFNGFGLLQVISEHVYELDALPLHHKDPFDRLLIAQARHEGLTLLTRDPKMELYEVDLLWWSSLPHMSPHIIRHNRAPLPHPPRPGAGFAFRLSAGTDALSPARSTFRQSPGAMM